jgi:transposase-like protein
LERSTRRRETHAVITSPAVSSAPAGYRFPREVIAVAVRWYLRYGLSYRDVEELLAESVWGSITSARQVGASVRRRDGIR